MHCSLRVVSHVGVSLTHTLVIAAIIMSHGASKGMDTEQCGTAGLCFLGMGWLCLLGQVAGSCQLIVMTEGA